MFKRFLCWLLVKACFIKKPDFVTAYSVRQPKTDELVVGELVVVGDGEKKKWACFKCPGGCGEKIMLCLSPKRSPHWVVTTDFLNRPSAFPSVWQQNDCKCHFWINKGNIKWCRD